MTALLPWVTGLRGATRHVRQSVLLALLAAVVVASAFAASTINDTGTIQADDLANVAMGQADMLVRTGDGVRVNDIVAPTSGRDHGITHLVQDLDLTVAIDGSSGTQTLSGRILPYDDPVTAGMFVRGERFAGAGELALSPAAARALGVEVGDAVVVETRDGGARLTFELELALAPDTSQAFFVLNPDAVSAATVDRILASAVSVGTPRWLVASSDLPTVATYIETMGLRALTRSGYAAPERASWLPLEWMMPAVAMCAISLMAGGATALARAHRRQVGVLDRLGAPSRAVRASIVVESFVAAFMGVAVALPLGLVAARVGSSVLERSALQAWGALRPSWTTFALAAAGTLIATPLVALVSVADPHARPRAAAPAFAPHPSSSRVSGATFLGRRLAEKSRRSTWSGAVAVTLVTAVGAASLLIVDVARASHEAFYEPTLPPGVAALSVPRPLTQEERATLAARSNSAVLEDRRAAFTRDASGVPVPVVLDSDATRCLRDQSDLAACVTASGTIAERSVAVAGVREVEGLFGRALSDREREAFVNGDGLLLASVDETPELVAPGRYQAMSGAESVRIPIAPVAVDGFDVDRYPGLLVTEAALTDWGLFLDDTPISYYLLSPIVAPVADAAVRSALPDDLQAIAEVLVDTGPAMLRDLLAATRTIMAVTIVLVFFVVMLLMMTWANENAQVLRSLRFLGAGRRELVSILVARGVRAVGAGAATGLVLSLALTWGFARYVGVAVPITGLGWVLPALASLGALLVAAGVHVGLGYDDRVAGGRRQV